jgi:acylphosphatase
MFIYGDVTGVGFRFWTRVQALNLGISGWVKNSADDCVEAIFEGEDEKVDTMVKNCHNGPEVSWVEKVEVKEEEFKGEFGSFEIVR